MPGGLEVGSVYATGGMRLDETGFDRWERKYNEAERKSKNRIVAHGDFKGDTAGIDGYNRRLETANRHGDDFVRGSGRMRGALGTLAVGGAGVAAVGLGFYTLGKGVMSTTAAFEESEKVGRRQALVIKTMGQDAGASAGHVDKLAASLARKTGIDDDAIISGANMIRTFRNIRNEAGKGNDIFDRTTKAALDLSSAFDMDLSSASIMLGKALDNPSRGAAALSKNGAIAKDDVEKLKKMAESGVPILEQQKFVLEAVENQVKGTAESNATATDKMKQSWGEFSEWIGSKVAPAFNKGVDFVRGFTDDMRAGTGTAGKFRDALDDVGKGASSGFGSAMKYAKDRIDENRKSIGTIGQNYQRVFNVVGRVLGGVKKAFSDTFGAKSGVGRDIRNIIGAIFSIVAAVGKFTSQLAQKLIKPVTQIFRGLFQVIRGIIRIISGIVTGDFGKMWDGVKDIFSGAVKVVLGILKGAITILRAAAGLIIKGIAAAFRAGWSGIKALFSAAVKGLWSVLKGAVGLLVDAGEALIKGVVKGVKSAPGALADVGKWVGEKIRSAVASVWKAFYSVGSFLLDKIKDGFKAAVGGLASVGKDLVGAIKKGIGGAISIPFRLTGSGDPPAGSIAGGWKGGTLGFANKIGKKFGLHITSTYRSPAENAAAGGVPNSMHTHGSPRNPGAIDMVGPTGNMYEAAQAARAAGVPEVLVHDVGSGLHLHMGFFAQGGKVGPTSGGWRAFIAGEGGKDEWVISQEGNRKNNVGWAVDALSTLTGKRVALYKGGKGRKKPPKPKLSAKSNRGIKRSIARGEKGLPAHEKKIQNLEREYDLLDREFGGGDTSDFMIENDDGSVTIDEGKRNTMIANLDKLIAKRDEIKAAIEAYKTAVQKAIEKYDSALKKLRKALKAAKGKRRSKERAGYRATINDYQARVTELRDVFNDLGYDLEDTRLDRAELVDERAEFAGAQGKPADAGAGGSDGGSGPATPMQIAEAAAAQLASFNASRADLFANFGSNFTPAGKNPFADESQRAAGMRYYGAFGSSDTAGASGSSGKTINVTNNYAAPPPDPHSWTQQQRFELENL